MPDILIELAAYLQAGLTETTAVSCYEMADSPAKYVLVQSIPAELPSPPQIDAISTRIRVTARDSSNVAAFALADSCWKLLYEQPPEEPTGFIKLKDTWIFVDLCGKPAWQKSDQKGNKYFSFEAIITTAK